MWTQADSNFGAKKLPQLRSINPTLCECSPYLNNSLVTGSSFLLAIPVATLANVCGHHLLSSVCTCFLLFLLFAGVRVASLRSLIGMLGDEVLQVLGHLDVAEADGLGQRSLFPSGQGIGVKKQLV